MTDLNKLYNEFSETGTTITFDEFSEGMKDDGFKSFVDTEVEGLKKKDNPQPTVESSMPDIPTNLPKDFSVPMGSETDLPLLEKQKEDSMLGTEETPTSTELASQPMASLSVESQSNNNLLPQKTMGDSAKGLPKVVNPISRNILPNNDYQKIEINIDILAGKSNDIQGDIVPKLATPEEITIDEARSLEESNQSRINEDKQSKNFFDQYLNKDYIDTKATIRKQPFDTYGVSTEENEDEILVLEDQGIIKIKKDQEGNLVNENNKYVYKIVDKDYYDNTYVPYIDKKQKELTAKIKDQNIDSARFNLGNVGNEPEQDGFGEFVTKANNLGVIPTNEEYEQLTTDESRNEYLATLEATQNAQKNGTTFQEEYDKVIPKYTLTEQVKIANGFDAVNLLNQGIKNGDTKDQSEINYFTQFFSDKNNVMDFGEYWEREGKAKHKSSLIRENQANYQANRSNIWNEYLDYKNNKLGTNQRFLEEAVVQSSALADKYAQEGNIKALENEKVKMENLYAQYELNEGKMIEVSNIYSESNKNFTSLAEKRKEESDFQIKVQNGEVGANVKNILGQIPLAISSSITSTLTGIARIGSSIISSDNLKDAVDIVSDTELKVGNIKVASLTDKIKIFEGSDGFKYKEINGRTYGLKDNGEIFKTNYKYNGSEKTIKEDVEYNGSGMVFLTAKMASDIYMTTGVGKGINATIGSSANRIANSTKVAQVFGEGSQMAKTASSFARLAKNADNVSVTGWYVQMYNDSYRMAEDGGISDPVNKHLYAITMSFMQSMIQRINPDTNFLKPLNTNARQVAKALISESPSTAKQVVSKFLKETADASIQFAKKSGNNVPKEVLEEVIQQGTQDISNLVINASSNTNLQTSTKQDYEEVVVGTIVPAAVASLLGGNGSRTVKLNNKEIDLSTYSRNDLITELARDTNGSNIIKDFKDNAAFQSQKDSAHKIENEISTRKKYIDKIPDVQIYSTQSLSEVSPILQQIDKKKGELKNDDGTFSERINKDIAQLTEKVNNILDNDLNPENINNAETETAQPTPQPEAVQDQTTETQQPEVANQSEQPTITGEQNVPSELNPATDTNINTIENESETSKQEESRNDGTPQSSEGINDQADDTVGQTEQDQDTQDQATEEVTDEDLAEIDAEIESLKQLQNEGRKQTETLDVDGNNELTDNGIQESEQGQDENNQQEVPNTTNDRTSEGENEVNPSEYNFNNRNYTRQNDGSFTSLDKNGKERKVTSKNIINSLNELHDKANILNQTEKDGNLLNETKTIHQTSNSKLKLHVKTYDNSIKSFDFYNSKGDKVKVSEKTAQKHITDYLLSQDFEQTEIPDGASEKDAIDIILNETNNPIELANEILRLPKYEDYAGSKEWHIATKSRRVTQESFEQAKDANNVTPTIKRFHFVNKGTGKSINTLDRWAFEASSEFAGGNYGNDEITIEDVGDFIINNPFGADSFLKKLNPDFIKAKERFRELTGLNPSPSIISKLLGQQELTQESKIELQKKAEAYYDKLSVENQKKLADDYDSWFNSLTLDEQNNELLKTYPNEIFKNPEEKTKIQPESNNSKRQSGKDANVESAERSREKTENVNSPEYKSLLAKRDDAEKEVANKKAKLDSVSKKTNKDFQGDQEDLFGERPEQQGMFDERADGNAGKEIIATAKSEYDKARAELSRLNNAIRDFESGKVKGTEAIDFEITEQATQSRNKNIVTERIKPEKRNTTKSVKKLNQIISDAAKSLKSTLIYGKPLSRNAAGTYNPSNTLIRIKNAGDLDTVAHELGHFIDDKYDFIGSLRQSDIIALDKEIKWFSERGGSNPPSKLSPKMQAEYRNREGLAEFIRAYLFNPTATETIAPNLYKEFEKILDNEAKQSLKDFSEDLINFYNASNGDKITSNIQDSGLKNKESFLKFKKDNNGFGYSIFDKINANVFDSMSKANKAFAFINKLNGNDIKSILPENNFKVLHRVFAGVNGKIDKVLTKGMVDGKNNYILDSKGEKMTMEWLLSPLDSTSEETVRADMNEVIRLLVAQRTLEYAKKFQRVDSLTGIGAGIDSDLDIAQGFINDFNDLKDTNKEKFDRITEAARKYREYADAGLKYAVDKGRLAEEVLDNEGNLIGGYQYIKQNNEYYVNLTRIKEITPLNEDDAFFGDTGSLTSAKEILKKAKGGTETIRNPYESLLMNTANIIKESDRNEIMTSFFEPLKNMRNMGDGTPIDFAQIARPAGTNDKNVKTIYVNGIKERWQISADVVDAFNSLEGMSKDGFFLKVLQFPAKVLRNTVTHFPVFAARNVTRDSVSRVIMSRTGSGFKDMIHNSSDSDMFSLYGGSMAGYYGNGKEAYIKHLNSAVKKISQKGGIVINPLQKYSDFLQASENINRIAEYKSSFRQAKNDGLDDYNAGLYAAFEARDLMDFAMSGVYIREINKYIPFINAGFQGLVRVKKQVTERPIVWAVKTAIYTIIPSLVASAIRHMSDDDDDYEELPAYQKDLFWNFRTPYTGNAWISIPKPYENGAVSALVDRATSKIMGKDEAFDGLSGSLFQSLIPIDQSSWLGGFKPIIENMFNKDTFRGGTIVSQWEENKLKELRNGDVNASRIGQIISNGLYNTGYDLNPHKIDHLIKGYGTYFGDLALKIGDVGVQNSRNKFTISQIGFAKDIPLSNAKTVSKVYDLAESLGETQNKDVKSLRTMIQGYYESSSDKEQLQMSREIYKVAKIILGNLEKEKGSKILAIDLANKRSRGEILPNDVARIVDSYIKKSPYINKDYAREKIIKDYNNKVEKLKLKNK